MSMWLTVVLLAAGAGEGRIAVLPAQIEKDAAGDVPQLFDDYILTAVQEITRAEVIGQNDIDAMLGFEKQKDLLGCQDDMACMAEIGGALGVDRLVVVQVARVAGEWVLTSKVIDIREVRVESRSNDMIAGDVKALLEAIPRVVRKLFQGGGMAITSSRPTPPPRPPAPQPLSPPSPKVAANPAMGGGARTLGMVLSIAGLGGALVSLSVSRSLATDKPGAYDVAWEEDGYQGVWTGSDCREIPSHLSASDLESNPTLGSSLDDSECDVWNSSGAMALAALYGGSLAVLGYGSGLHLDGRAQRASGDAGATGFHGIRWLGWLGTGIAAGGLVVSSLLESEALAYLTGVGGGVMAAWVFSSTLWTDSARAYTSTGSTVAISSVIPVLDGRGNVGLGWQMGIRF